MWKALEPTERSLDLRRLLARFRAQELSMMAVLDSLQAELTHVRMAIAGASEEIAEHEAMFTASHRPHPGMRHATPA